MYKIVASRKFQKDFKKALKRGLKESLLKDVALLLEKSGNLPPKFKSHKLSGKYNGLWECHIQPDWLLIWDQDEEVRLITLLRTGTHSDLF
ncbi:MULTISPECIES: type II toxin-antitoxin system RelE/ParE family toxin [Epilithonimonas]|jgi:mRNA interferase YafQ|uniref:Type II toxin-antitoxin system YafQ family toxin n=1 Tax=Epilithonimonas vandammei TaxID=2487072 RepID=A0A3G8ZES6_9FLAO|nr:MULTISPECIES: type II toxin-antitoxin system YafQ family toxin [Epilithonimonas]AZI55892.1 type II toxin-antitoxin system YafQ family toxin [Epilithonimonas vandammei]HAP96596.1 type II toxin-antitoxin system mRNA interferase toxin, RelE/StbE family [Chryseobacterium sp.]